MNGELTTIVEAAPGGGYWALCPEVPGANGQGDTIEDAKQSLALAIRLIRQDRHDAMPHALTGEQQASEWQEALGGY